MNLETIHTLARDHGIDPTSMLKGEIIRAIQRHEGNFDCFGSAIGHCDQLGCSWRSDCLSPQEETTSLAATAPLTPTTPAPIVNDPPAAPPVAKKSRSRATSTTTSTTTKKGTTSRKKSTVST
jgi:hypothetical protein